MKNKETVSKKVNSVSHTKEKTYTRLTSKDLKTLRGGRLEPIRREGGY